MTTYVKGGDYSDETTEKSYYVVLLSSIRGIFTFFSSLFRFYCLDSNLTVMIHTHRSHGRHFSHSRHLFSGGKKQKNKNKYLHQEVMETKI